MEVTGKERAKRNSWHWKLGLGKVKEEEGRGGTSEQRMQNGRGKGGI